MYLLGGTVLNDRFAQYIVGLFNISDKVLVSLDILLEWREEFKRGVPPTTAVESKLATLSKKSSKVC